VAALCWKPSPGSVGIGQQEGWGGGVNSLSIDRLICRLRGFFICRFLGSASFPPTVRRVERGLHGSKKRGRGRSQEGLKSARETFDSAQGILKHRRQGASAVTTGRVRTDESSKWDVISSAPRKEDFGSGLPRRACGRVLSPSRHNGTTPQVELGEREEEPNQSKKSENAEYNLEGFVHEPCLHFQEDLREENNASRKNKVKGGRKRLARLRAAGIRSFLCGVPRLSRK